MAIQITVYNYLTEDMGNCDGGPANSELPEENLVRTKFNPFFEVNAPESNEHLILSKYKFVSNYDDRFLGRCNVLEGREDGNLYLSKDLVFYSEEECGQAYLKFKQIKEQQHKTEEVLRIREIFTKKVDGFFNDGNKIIILVEYPLISLKKEFNNRLLNRLEFGKEEITNILYSAIRGYAAIERTGSPNDRVRMAHIFIGVRQKESLIKVIDSNLLAGPSNFKCLKDYGASSAEHYDVCVSPEQFDAYNNSAQNGWTPNSGVFSLGVTVLNLCLMEPAHPFYHFHTKFIDKNQLKSLISIAGKKHGQNLQKFLLEMTEIDPTKRPSFAQMQARIPSMFAQNTGDKSLRLSVVQDGNSNYIRNDNKSLRDSRVSNSSRSRSRSRSKSPNRMFASSIEVEKAEDEQLENIHEEYTNGNQYMGQKKNGLKHGKGKYIFKDRSYYEGNWRNNQMNGKGELYLPNGKLEYVGEWKNGEQHGWGIMYSYDTESQDTVWSKYEGEFKKGEMEGRGKLYFVNGTIYEGELRGGKILGKGRRVGSSGNVVQKQWGLQTIEEFINQGGVSSYHLDR